MKPDCNAASLNVCHSAGWYGALRLFQMANICHRDYTGLFSNRNTFPSQVCECDCLYVKQVIFGEDYKRVRNICDTVYEFFMLPELSKKEK